MKLAVVAATCLAVQVSCISFRQSKAHKQRETTCTKTGVLVASDKVPAGVIDLSPWKLQLPCADEACTDTYSQRVVGVSAGPKAKNVNDLSSFSLVPRRTSTGICSGGFYASKDGSEDVVVL